MAIRIPRSEGAGSPQRAGVRVQPATEATRQMSGIAEQLQQLGGQFREIQHRRDISDAGTKVLAERRIIERQAEERGLSGNEYETFMAENMAITRAEAVDLGTLPETKRALSNTFNEQEAADRLQFAAEGRRRQAAQAEEAFTENMDVLNSAASNQYLMRPDGSMDESVIEFWQQSQMNAAVLPGMGEDEKTRIQHEAGSSTLRATGEEMIIGYTRNGEGQPGDLLDILNDDNHFFTEKLTEPDRSYLKRLAFKTGQQQAQRTRSARNALANRVKLINDNIGELERNNAHVPSELYEELERDARRLAQQHGVDPRFVQDAAGLTIEQERIRQILRGVEHRQIEQDAYADVSGLPISRLREMEAELTTRLNRELPEGTAVSNFLYDSEMQMQLAAEPQRNMVALKAVRRRMSELDDAQGKGELLKLRMNQDPSLAASPVMATLDFEDQDQAFAITQARMAGDEITATSEMYGRTATVWARDEIQSFAQQAPNMTDRQVTAYAKLFSQGATSAPDEVRETLRHMPGDLRWAMTGAAQQLEAGNSLMAERIISGWRQAEAGRQTQIIRDSGQFDMEIGGIANATFRDPEAAATIEQAVRFAYLGMKRGETDAVWKEKEIKDIVGQMYPNGVSWDGPKFMPLPQTTGRFPDRDMGRMAGPPASEREATRTPTDFRRDIANQIRPEQFDGRVLPKIAMDRMLDPDVVGRTVEEQLVRAIQEGDVEWVPDADEPGAYGLMVMDPGIFEGVGEGGFIMEETPDGRRRPMRLNFNGYYERIQAGMQ